MSPFWICTGWGFLVVAFAHANPFGWSSMLARVFPVALAFWSFVGLWPEYPSGLIMLQFMLGMTIWLGVYEVWQRARGN